MSHEEIFFLLKQLKPELQEKYKTKLLAVFGSYAKNKEKQDSDLDLLAEFSPGATLIDVTGAQLLLEEKLNLKVDLVSKNALRKEILPNILKEQIEI